MAIINVNDTERDIMEHKGRIVKVCFADQPVPHVGWYWLELGNCRTCKYWVNPWADFDHPRCINPNITRTEYQEYLDNDLCPSYEAGAVPEREVPLLIDLLKAIGQLPGKPSQTIEVLQNVPWTPGNSLRAHEQQEYFLSLARDKDQGDENLGEDDFSNELEPIEESDGND